MKEGKGCLVITLDPQKPMKIMHAGEEMQIILKCAQKGQARLVFLAPPSFKIHRKIFDEKDQAAKASDVGSEGILQKP